MIESSVVIYRRSQKRKGECLERSIASGRENLGGTDSYVQISGVHVQGSREQSYGPWVEFSSGQCSACLRKNMSIDFSPFQQKNCRVPLKALYMVLHRVHGEQEEKMTQCSPSKDLLAN